MRVFRALKKQVSKSIKVLKRHFGISATIYYPIQFNNKQHGYWDEDVKYDEGRDAKILIPALFRKQNQTLALLDSFYDPGEIVLFEENQILWPAFAKIIVNYDGKVRNYIIDAIREIKDDEVADPTQVIFRTYILVPSSAIDIERNRDQLIDALNDETDPNTIEEAPPNESLTSLPPPTSTPPAGIVFKPIK